MVSTVRIGSLKQALSAQPIKEKEVEQVALAEETQSDLKPPSEKDFEEFSRHYAAKLAKSQKRGLAAFYKDPLYKLEGDKLTFIVGSKTLKNEIEGDLPSFSKQLNKKGFNLTVDFQINAEKVAEYKLFTPKQQYDALAKKYPELKEFAQRFGLDFDV